MYLSYIIYILLYAVVWEKLVVENIHEKKNSW